MASELIKRMRDDLDDTIDDTGEVVKTRRFAVGTFEWEIDLTDENWNEFWKRLPRMWRRPAGHPASGRRPTRRPLACRRVIRPRRSATASESGRATTGLSAHRSGGCRDTSPRLMTVRC